MSTVLPALVLAAFAVVLLAAIVYVLIKSLSGIGVGWTERWRLARRQNMLAAADRILENSSDASRFVEGLRLLRESFYFESHFSDSASIERLGHHHQNVLARMVGLSERNNFHLDPLPVVEDLLLNRHELLREFADIRRSRSEVKRKQKDKGRNAPEWALSEFDKKIQELSDRLTTNRRSLESQLNEIFRVLATSKREGEVTYH